FELLASIYADLRLYINFFQPVLKLVFKGRVDGKFIKTYDKASTPYQRIMARLVSPIFMLDSIRLLYAIRLTEK
ncbi:MAG: transposase, partial [Anaerolineaceae bacterium]